MLLLGFDSPIQVHLVEQGQHATLDAVPVNFKEFQKMPSLPEVLLQAPLLIAAFSSSLMVGVSRKSLHPSGKVLCPAFSILVTHAPTT
jgi:hypothetical protein